MAKAVEGKLYLSVFNALPALPDDDVDTICQRQRPFFDPSPSPDRRGKERKEKTNRYLRMAGNTATPSHMPCMLPHWAGRHAF